LNINITAIQLTAYHCLVHYTKLASFPGPIQKIEKGPGNTSV